MHDGGKSDTLIVPKKPANEGRAQARLEEPGEGRGVAKGNPGEHTRFRTQSRIDLSHALDRIRNAAKEDKELQFTALWHHVYTIDRLREAYGSLKREAAPGVDGLTWQAYGKALEENLKDLSARLARGAYRAQPVKRVYIPKGDGRLRPIGITALEDKLVQRAVTQVLNAVYEADFLGFSYGFRPGRSQHNALDAITVGIETRKISWVLDADIQGFFDTMDHEWVLRFLRHRIGDRRVLRHVEKWLKAGVLEDGAWRKEREGVPQGGSICPLLANIYLHYALDLWVEQWRRKHARGEVIIVRYADDFVVGFQYQNDAKRFYEALQARLEKFHLKVNTDKTRLIVFGRFAEQRRAERAQGKPETFNFLGFTHICSKTRQGHFCVLRKTMKKKVRAKLKAIKEELRKRLHQSIAQVGRWLSAVLQGHYRYYGVPRNSKSLSGFRHALLDYWRRALRRRSHKTHRITWSRMHELASRWLPQPRIVHPYPQERCCVTTRGRSPVR